MDGWAEVVEYYIYGWADIRDIKYLLPRQVGQGGGILHIRVGRGWYKIFIA
jgi:hypothetical protein